MIRRVDFASQRDILSLRYACLRAPNFAVVLDAGCYRS